MKFVIFKLIIVFVFSIGVFYSCKKVENERSGEFSNEKIYADDFNFTTSKTVALNLRILANNNQALKGVPVLIYTPGKDTLFRGATDVNGSLKATIDVPSSADKIIVDPLYLGFTDKVEASIQNNVINGVIGGDKGFSGDFSSYSDEVDPGGFSALKLANTIPGNETAATTTTYEYMGTYDATGRPGYLLPTPDVIDNSFLNYVNQAIPEIRNYVPNNRPQYLSEQVPEALKIIKKSDVWITFVHEGANNSNVLGYYTYPTSVPPQSAAEINNIKLIFPNASFDKTGSLRSGDKVHLGVFEPNVSIGFVLLANAWDASNKVVKTNTVKFYTDSRLNPESTKELKKHTVLLKYAPDIKFLIGFEDINRALGSCDHDFNDLVFYAKANPVDGIDDTGIPEMPSPNDCDKDGVIDLYDEFVCDPLRSSSTFLNGTLAFEDRWPLKGDYDMNDLVLSYQYKFIKNAAGKLVELFATYNVLAVGADYENGFGVEFPFNASTVSAVSGYKLFGNYISLNSNGTESGHTKAVIIPFDKARRLFASSSSYINTLPTQQRLTAEPIKVKVSFSTPIDMPATQQINPFLIVNGKRGSEIHLADFAPTQKADLSLLSTEDDNSVPSQNRYYRSSSNWPWVLNMAGASTFIYPQEKKGLNRAYLHFFDWAKSSGTAFKDWYTSVASGYRNEALLYK